MAEGIATRSSRGHRTICLPIEEEDYLRIIHDPKAFRRTLDDCFRQTPELFPVNFALGYELKDDRMSAKQQIPIRRILLKDDSAYSIRPSFLMPYMTGTRRTSKDHCFCASLASRSGPWPASSAVIRCPGIAWSAGWAGSALWEPPSARRRCPSTYWPTSIIKGSTARRSTSPRPSATGAAWERNRPRRQGATS